MHFPLAKYLAVHYGYSIRRKIWNGEDEDLAWLRYKSGLWFWQDENGERVAEHLDMEEDDFLALDWTTLGNACDIDEHLNNIPPTVVMFGVRPYRYFVGVNPDAQLRDLQNPNNTLGAGDCTVPSVEPLPPVAPIPPIPIPGIPVSPPDESSSFPPIPSPPAVGTGGGGGGGGQDPTYNPTDPTYDPPSLELTMETDLPDCVPRLFNAEWGAYCDPDHSPVPFNYIGGTLEIGDWLGPPGVLWHWKVTFNGDTIENGVAAAGDSVDFSYTESEEIAEGQSFTFHAEIWQTNYGMNTASDVIGRPPPCPIPPLCFNPGSGGSGAPPP